MPETVTVTISGECIEALGELISRAITDELETARTQEPGFLDVDGAAAYLSSTPTAIRSLVKRDAIPYHKAPNGRLLFVPDELDTWARSG